MFFGFKNTDPAQLGGWAFQAGNFGLLALGGYKGDWSELAGAISWIVTAEILRRRGDHNNWFALSCITSIIAMCLTNYDELKTVNIAGLATPSSHGMATLIGTILFAVGYGIFGAFSAPLTHSFKNAKSKVLRGVLGHSRLIAGILAIISMFPMIRDVIADKNIGMAVIITLFMLGEILIAISSPNLAEIF